MLPLLRLGDRVWVRLTDTFETLIRVFVEKDSLPVIHLMSIGFDRKKRQVSEWEVENISACAMVLWGGKRKDNS